MNHLLLDTNIYGLLITDRDFHYLHSKLEAFKQTKQFLVYGLDVIRRELKASPRIKIGGVNLQATLLRAYSSFTIKEYTLEDRFQEVADEYYRTYTSLGGNLPKTELNTDFLIVACASWRGINIVVSEDNATMLSELSIHAYKKVNRQKELHFPEFIGYQKFKTLLKGTGTGFSDPIINCPNKFGILLSFLYIFPFIYFGFLFHTYSERKHIYKRFALIP